MEYLQKIGAVAGLGGIALAVLLLIFRDAVAPQLPNLTKAQSYALLRAIIVASFVVALGGIAAWAWVETRPDEVANRQARADCSPEARPSSDAAGVISAGGKVAAQRDIRVSGAEQLARPGVSADCGDVTAGRDIEVNAGTEGSAAPETK